MRGSGGHLLYLDFDGVLHPSDVYWHPRRGVYLHPGVQGHALFENVPLLLEALEPFSRVKVVLSTSWVPARGYAKTVKRLPSALRDRIIGATFHSGYMLHETWRAIARGYQVLGDVGRRRPKRWVALDDDFEDWPAEHADKLVKTHDRLGLRRPGAVEELVRHFKSWTSPEGQG